MSSKRGCTSPTKPSPWAVSPTPAYAKSTKAAASILYCWTNGPLLRGKSHPAWPKVALSELGEGVKVGEWAASNRNDRNCCLLIYFYLHLISPPFSPPVYTMLSPLNVLSPSPHHLCGQPLAHFTLPFCYHGCLPEWGDGRMVCVVTRGH